MSEKKSRGPEEGSGSGKGQSESHQMAQFDARHISDQWHGALKEYYGLTGLDPEHKFDTTTAIIDWGNNELGHLSKTHRKEQKTGRLRALFIRNIDHIVATSQLLDQATIAALHPAVTLGAVVAYTLIGLRDNWEDYDAFLVFFEDVNALLQRSAILASRFLQDNTCEEPLIGVFGDLVRICGNAQKQTELGVFSKHQSPNSLTRNYTKTNNQSIRALDEGFIDQ